MKKVEDGAPAYFGLFCSLMTVLLAFFILLTCLSTKQESGYHKGIGDIRNAFGLKGGFGLFGYAHMVRGSAHHKVNAELTAGEGLDSLHENMVAGEGGSGTTDADIQPARQPRYLRVQVPYAFPPGTHALSGPMTEYLLVAGTALALLDYRLHIKVVAVENGELKQDRDLAMRRAATIAEYLHSHCRLPYARLQSSGYAIPPAADSPAGPRQSAIWMDIYQPAALVDHSPNIHP